MKREKIKKFFIIFFALYVILTALSVFFHTHSSEADSDNCRLCYLITTFQSGIFTCLIVLVIYLSFYLFLLTQKIILSESNLAEFLIRAPPNPAL